MTTYRDESEPGDTMARHYIPATALLVQKLYAEVPRRSGEAAEADGKGPSYTYTPDGKLSTRSWSRGVTTTYAYDVAGQLTGVDYSDNTPDIAYTYDRLGRQLSAVSSVSTNLFEYDGLDLVAETQNGVVIDRATDSLGRVTGFSVAGVGGPSSPYAVTYGYDTYGRFSSVSSSVDSALFAVNYSYLSGSSLISGMTASSGHSWSRSYEPARSLITAVENRFGETVISRFDYVNDEIGRRISRADSGQAFQNPAFDVYSYNTRSEVSGAQRYHGTDTADTTRPFGGRGFGYAYDPTGNRLSATETIGGETLTKSYTANALNQYTAIANPDAVGLRGTATNTATVTVNGNAASRDNIASDTVPWHYALLADNANGGAYTFAEIFAVVNPPGTNTPDIVESTSGNVYAPPQNEPLTYDDDGNLLSDGRWQYTWNGENRLVKAEELASPTNRLPHVVEYTYDHRGRMIWKTVASPSAPPTKTVQYTWDDFNIIAETIAQDTATNTTWNIWGLDIDGTLQGAGGVGGLLAVVKDSATYIPAWDANGNILEYIAEDGMIVVHREYDPFGGTVVATGDTDAFTHWFSTKPWCQVSGLCEYQYRKYSSVLGRWLNRDPIGEWGGSALYNAFEGMPVGKIDPVGWETKILPDFLPDGVDGFSDRLAKMQASGKINEMLRKHQPDQKSDHKKADCSRYPNPPGSWGWDIIWGKSGYANEAEYQLFEMTKVFHSFVTQQKLTLSAPVPRIPGGRIGITINKDDTVQVSGTAIAIMKVREPYQDWACSCYATLGIAYQATKARTSPRRDHPPFRSAAASPFGRVAHPETPTGFRGR